MGKRKPACGIWRCDVTVELSEMLPQLEATQVDITIRVSAKLNVTKVAARRKVNRHYRK